MSKANIALASNIMLDDQAHLPERDYLPGDYLVIVYPEKMDRRVHDRAMTRITPRQRHEFEQIIVCVRCHRPCAGTCGP